MATLNLNEKKIPSAENLRLLSSLILSLSSKQGAIENKLINNWVASTAYIKDESFVIYDELLYVCKISNADDTFDKNKWTCLSPVISELTKADVAALINLSPEEISKLSDLISTEIRLDKTFSSSDTYMRIQAAIETAKEYTNEQTGKCVKPAYKVVASTSEITETGYFYLISNGTNYDMYVLSSDGSVVSLGTSDVDLSDYAKTSDLEADYLKSSDADGKFATITTVDNHINDTVAHMTQDEKDSYVKKTSMSTTIDENSTNDTIPTSKAIYDTISDLKTNFQDGVNTIYDAVVAKGVTPVDNSPSSIAEAIAKLGLIYIENLIPTMTSNTSPSGLAFADSEVSSGLYAAFRAFDGKTAPEPSVAYNLWASNNGANAFIGYRFDTPTKVTELSFIGRYDSPYAMQSPKTVKVQYSDDNLTWHDATDVIDIDPPTAGVMRTDRINIDNSSYHLYWRLFILTNYAGTNSNIAVVEMQMSGYKK